MTNGAPTTLESWAAFKKGVLEVGVWEVAAMKKIGKKDWVSALKREMIPPEDIMSAVTKANWQVWARAMPPARRLPMWPMAVPKYEVPPQQSKHFEPSTSSISGTVGSSSSSSNGSS